MKQKKYIYIIFLKKHPKKDSSQIKLFHQIRHSRYEIMITL